MNSFGLKKDNKWKKRQLIKDDKNLFRVKTK